MKLVIIAIIGGVLLLLGAIGFGLYSMDIEDHYGGLEEVFYKARSGDIIWNRGWKGIAKVEKGWRRISVIDSRGKSYDLNDWISQDLKGQYMELYRLKQKEEVTDTTSLKELIARGNATMIYSMDW